MHAKPDVSVVIVNWNSTEFLRKALVSIKANTRSRVEVVVVDNCSNDGCGEMLAAEFPEVRFVQSTANVGFASANNLGFRASSGRLVLFLNPDTELVGSAIDRMAAVIDATPGAGVVGARLLNSDMTVQTSCIQSYPTVLNQALDADFLRRRFPRSRLWGTAPLFDAGEEPAVVEMISGACQMVRREVFELVGLYPATYFMYAEDIELCLKCQQAGLKNYYVPDAVVVHHGGKSASFKEESNFSAVMGRESLYQFFRTNYGARSALGYRIAIGMVSFLRVGAMSLAMLLSLGLFKRAALRNAIRKWVGILRWSLGFESWARRMTPVAAVPAAAPEREGVGSAV